MKKTPELGLSTGDFMTVAMDEIFDRVGSDAIPGNTGLIMRAFRQVIVDNPSTTFREVDWAPGVPEHAPHSAALSRALANLRGMDGLIHRRDAWERGQPLGGWAEEVRPNLTDGQKEEISSIAEQYVRNIGALPANMDRVDLKRRKTSD